MQKITVSAAILVLTLLGGCVPVYVPVVANHPYPQYTAPMSKPTAAPQREEVVQKRPLPIWKQKQLAREAAEREKDAVLQSPFKQPASTPAENNAVLPSPFGSSAPGMIDEQARADAAKAKETADAAAELAGALYKEVRRGPQPKKSESSSSGKLPTKGLQQLPSGAGECKGTAKELHIENFFGVKVVPVIDGKYVGNWIEERGTGVLCLPQEGENHTVVLYGLNADGSKVAWKSQSFTLNDNDYQTTRWHGPYLAAKPSDFRSYFPKK